jgi:hypothetical protein
MPKRRLFIYHQNVKINVVIPKESIFLFYNKTAFFPATHSIKKDYILLLKHDIIE